MKKIVLAALLSLTTNAFAEGMVTINGQIVHDKSNPHSYQEDFVFQPNTSVTIKLNTCQGGEDGECYVALKKSFTGVTAFPIPFELQAPKGVYAMQVSVRAAGGKKEQVGDLVNEYLIMVGKKNETVTVKASGLEACGSENSGGFCL